MTASFRALYVYIELYMYTQLVSFTSRADLLFRTIRLRFQDDLISSLCHASLTLVGIMIKGIYFLQDIDAHVICVHNIIFRVKMPTYVRPSTV